MTRLTDVTTGEEVEATMQDSNVRITIFRNSSTRLRGDIVLTPEDAAMLIAEVQMAIDGIDAAIKYRVRPHAEHHGLYSVYDDHTEGKPEVVVFVPETSGTNTQARAQAWADAANGQ